MIKTQSDIRYDVTWTTLGDYLEFLTKKGVSMNVASFVGATTVREHEIGFDDRPPTPDELQRMKELVRQAMREGALGVGTSLIYAPASYAKTDELIELTKVAGEFDGGYISHMRSEGDRFLEALDELIRIAREAKVNAQVYHFKAAGERNWPKMKQAIDEDRSGTCGRAAHHCRHVQLHRRCDRARRSDAALGAGRRAGRVDRASEAA